MATLATAACAHQSFEGRVETFRAMARSLPACPTGQAAMRPSEAAAMQVSPGDVLMVRGHLAAVGWGPPCEGSDPPSSGRHCAVIWTLWDTADHPPDFADSLPGGVVTLAASPGGGGPLPALTSDLDVKASSTAIGDLDVIVAGALPAACQRETGHPMFDSQTTKIECVPVSAGLYPLTVVRLCRSLAAPVRSSPPSRPPPTEFPGPAGSDSPM